MYLFVVITTDLMLLPLQGVFCMSLLPRVSLRFAQGYELVALSGRFFPLLTLYYYYCHACESEMPVPVTC